MTTILKPGNIFTYGSLGLIGAEIFTLTTASIEGAIEDLLLNDAAVASIVAARIYPNMVEQGEPVPAITYHQVSGPREHTADGPEGIVRSRFQISSWAETMSEARQLADAVRQRLDGFSGVVDSVTIGEIALSNEGDIPRVSAGNQEITFYGKFGDFMIWFEEDIA